MISSFNVEHMLFLDCFIIVCGWLVCSLHGLVRGDNMELGRDSDTGGQVCLYLASDMCAFVNYPFAVEYKDGWQLFQVLDLQLLFQK